VTDSNVLVVANPLMGGTNPCALEKVPTEAWQSGTLHAKAYIGAEETIVCSANASSNGLALEGASQTGLIEAGLRSPTTEKITSWFEDLWVAQGRSWTRRSGRKLNASEISGALRSCPSGRASPKGFSHHLPARLPALGSMFSG
jgi:hypothetical protein